LIWNPNQPIFCIARTGETPVLRLAGLNLRDHMRYLLPICIVATLLISCPSRAADDDDLRTSWPTLAGDLRRTGYSPGNLKAPGTVKWSVALDGERIGTAVEPIVVDGRVFISTHSGGVWALDAETGKPLWRFQAAGPVLQSPMFYRGGGEVEFGLFFADATGIVYRLSVRSGKPHWIRPQTGESFSTSPIVLAGDRTDDIVVIGSRSGNLFGIDAATGELQWKSALRAPIRQTAAAYDSSGPIYITAEDLRLRSINRWSGDVVWISSRMNGQSVRDYYPVIRRDFERARESPQPGKQAQSRPARNAKTWEDSVVLVRTSPSIQFSRRLSADTKVLAASAGIDATDWKSIDRWTKDAAQNRGTPQDWERERQAIAAHLASDTSAASLYAFDADKEKPLPLPPVLWAGGCQGSPAPPALLNMDKPTPWSPLGNMVVEYRTVYGNWNHGVAPLVAIGLYDATKNAVDHIDHSNGTPNAPWNTYWGTADEAKHFQVVGDAVVITHQGTLCLFDLKTKKLATIQGDRDTFGGYPGPPWARNEWHGPARGGAAVVGKSLYWISGSRIFRVDCDGVKKPNPPAVVYSAKDVETIKADPAAVGVPALRKAMDQNVGDLISHKWAPHACIPGLAGPEHSFTHSGETLEALAWAFPHLANERQVQAQTYVATLLRDHPPLSDRMIFDLAKGDRREIVDVAAEALKPRGDQPKLDPFANVAAVKLWTDRSGDKSVLESQWPAMQAVFAAFEKSHWKLDPAKGHLYANRYLASLLAYAEIAKARGDASADRAVKLADETAIALAAWWKRAAAEQRAMAGIEGVAKLDQFIGKGGGVFLAIIPHRHKLALFKDLTPAVLEAVRKQEPNAPQQAWDAFVKVAPTWYLVGEERQVHYGENAYDPPDFSLDAFRGARLIGQTKVKDLCRYADMPWGKADAYFIAKVAMALEE
jgi:hypothetical protein